MIEQLRDTPDLAHSLDIAAAAHAFLCRSGHAETEVRRRLLLRDTLRSSRALAHALEEFVKRAGAHYHGVHCTSHLDADVEALTRTLAAWSESMRETAMVYHECHRTATAHDVHTAKFSPPARANQG
jgi:hypothetical protein